jgi:hypothetical protein
MAKTADPQLHAYTRCRYSFTKCDQSVKVRSEFAGVDTPKSWEAIENNGIHAKYEFIYVYD